MSREITWRNRAMILDDMFLPLENQLGHWTHVREGKFITGMKFHPWDIDRDSYDERVNAGPATIVADPFAGARELGRKMGSELNDRWWKAFKEASCSWTQTGLG